MTKNKISEDFLLGQKMRQMNHFAREHDSCSFFPYSALMSLDAQEGLVWLFQKAAPPTTAAES